jgi:hypothetical protein
MVGPFEPEQVSGSRREGGGAGEIEVKTEIEEDGAGGPEGLDLGLGLDL